MQLPKLIAAHSILWRDYIFFEKGRSWLDIFVNPWWSILKDPNIAVEFVFLCYFSLFPYFADISVQCTTWILQSRVDWWFHCMYEHKFSEWHMWQRGYPENNSALSLANTQRVYFIRAKAAFLHPCFYNTDAYILSVWSCQTWERTALNKMLSDCCLKYSSVPNIRLLGLSLWFWAENVIEMERAEEWKPCHLCPHPAPCLAQSNSQELKLNSTTATTRKAWQFCSTLTDVWSIIFCPRKAVVYS